MSELLASDGRIEDTTDERARRAVANFRRLQPTLSAYVRNLTGDPLARVDMAAQDNGSTDGQRVYIRPPLALGDNTPHERRLCDVRDSDGTPACPACAVREDVLVRVYHEIGHIAFGSFQRVTDEDKRRAINAAIKETGGRYGPQIEARIQDERIYSFPQLVRLINEYLPFLVNCLEDARVDLAMFKARPGTHLMFEADAKKVFSKGFEVRKSDGTVEIKHWHEAPLNTQVMIGTLVKTLGYKYETWFHEQVVEALADGELTNLLNSMKTIRSAQEVYHLSFKVLARLRELGYCGTEADPDPEPEPDEQEDDSDEQPDPTPEQSDEDGDEGEGSASDSNAVPEESESEVPDEDPGDSESDGEGNLEPGEGSDSGEEGSEASGDDGSSDGDPEGAPEGSSDGSGDEQDDSDAEGSESESGGSEGSGLPEGEDESAGEAESGEADGPSSSDGSTTDDRGMDEAGEVDAEEDSEGDPSDAKGSDDGDLDGREAEGDPSLEPSDGLGTEDHGDPESEGDEGSGESVSELADELDSSGDTGDGDGSDGSSSGLDDDSVSEHSGGSPESGSGETSEGMDLDDDQFRGDPRRGDLATEGEAGSDDELSPEVSDGPEELGSDSEAAGLEGRGDIQAGDEDSEPVDTGADDGYGGTSVEGDSTPAPDFGNPDDVEEHLLKWGDHDEKPKSIEDKAADKAVDRAIVQGIYFTRPSNNVFGVKEYRYGDGTDSYTGAWSELRQERQSRRVGQKSELDVPEQILQPALGQMRRTFTDNRRGKHERNRKSGRVDARALGKRAPVADPRLFKKNNQPGKKDYFVVIGMDLSYSTVGVNLALEKRAVAAQAELLDRVGIPFAIYGHSAREYYGGRSDLYLDIYHVKDANEPWNEKTQARLAELGPVSANLDGHAMEFLRKRLEESNATDKILLYYSDGKMPAENHDEELEILIHEINVCRAKNHTLLGVGIRTDSPSRHGLETVEVHEDEDLVKVVQQLGRRLARK